MEIDQIAPLLDESEEYIHCNLCGSNKTSILYRLPVRTYQIGEFSRDIWDIVRCNQCGLIYQNPRPKGDILESFYQFKNPGQRDFVNDWFLDNEDMNQDYWQRILRTIHHHKPNGKMLDVGCGAGSFLELAQKIGYEVYGQEISPLFVEHCRKQKGLTIYDGELESLQLPPASFDIVTSFDVIEHHPYPKNLLREMRRLLKPGGLLIVGTHNIGNFFARLYRNRWRHLHPIGHLTYFTRNTLGKMLEDSGFNIIRCEGAHTIDGKRPAVLYNYFTQFLRVILLRSLILAIYKPITARFSGLTHWRIRWGNREMHHTKLLVRTGDQIIMNDDMIFLATMR